MEGWREKKKLCWEGGGRRERGEEGEGGRGDAARS